MTTYISMLRGINVGGRKKVKMDELKGLYESLGFGHVLTYIQSGNVVFEYERTEIPRLVDRIEKAMKARFGFDVPVVIRTRDEIERVIGKTPFAGKDDSKVHVTFLSGKPTGFPTDEISRVKAAKEEFAFSDEEVYLFCPGGYGATKLSNGFLEKKLKRTATTRNWRTVNVLLSMADQDLKSG